MMLIRVPPKNGLSSVPVSGSRKFIHGKYIDLHSPRAAPIVRFGVYPNY